MSAYPLLLVPAALDSAWIEQLSSILGSEPTGLILLFETDENEPDLVAFNKRTDWLSGLRQSLRQAETGKTAIAACLKDSVSGLAAEIACACHARFAIPGARWRWPWTKFGFPPALGTLHRLIFLTGWQPSLDAILFGSSVALEHHPFVEQTSADPVSAAEKWLRSKPSTRQPWDQQRIEDSPPFSQLSANRAHWQAAYLKLRRRTPPEDPTGGLILTAFHESLEREFDGALRVEAEMLLRALGTKSAKNKQYVHLNLRRGALARIDEQTPNIKVLGVIGSGLMGSGIAATAAACGCRVLVFETEPTRIQAAEEKWKRASEKAEASWAERITQAQKLTDLAAADLVVEAVFERLDVKQAVLSEISQYLPAESALASNTTTFPIGELAAAVKEPARFVGTHFFAPVEQMELLEIIRGAQTNPATVKQALRLAGQMRKVPIVVGDGPGFYTSRVVMAYVQEALFLLREGVSPAFIDHVAQNAGMVIGPLAMADLTSLDLLADIFRNLARHGRGAGAQAGQTVALLERFIASGRLGKKVGAGIYNYENNRAVAWTELKSWFPPRPSGLSAEAVRDRLFYIQAIETLCTLHEGVIPDLATADLASVLGWCFPDYRGGVMRAMAGPGESAFASVCFRLAEQFGPRFQLGR